MHVVVSVVFYRNQMWDQRVFVIMIVVLTRLTPRFVEGPTSSGQFTV
jgi:hypothetical protein